MGTRHESRELALQILYQQDANSRYPQRLEESLPGFWTMQEHSAEARGFAEELAHGVHAHQTEIDEKIRGIAKNWDFRRIAVVDRNILRLAIYELFFREDIPPVVSINEAIDLAKRFSTEDSGRFVNGILDRARMELTRPMRTATAPRPPKK